MRRYARIFCALSFPEKSLFTRCDTNTKHPHNPESRAASKVDANNTFRTSIFGRHECRAHTNTQSVQDWAHLSMQKGQDGALNSTHIDVQFRVNGKSSQTHTHTICVKLHRYRVRYEIMMDVRILHVCIDVCAYLKGRCVQFVLNPTCERNLSRMLSSRAEPIKLTLPRRLKDYAELLSNRPECMTCAEICACVPVCVCDEHTRTMGASIDFEPNEQRTNVRRKWTRTSNKT